MADIENGEQPELDLSDDKVVTKYKAAAEICNSEFPPGSVNWIETRRLVSQLGTSVCSRLASKQHINYICWFGKQLHMIVTTS